MTSYRGSDHYDQEVFLDHYLQRRSWNENANDTLEKPIIYEMMGDVEWKSILDLGCGTAIYGMELLEMGAAQYTGIEGSVQMVEHARQTLRDRSNSRVLHMFLEEWNAPETAYDQVVSRLVIHYIEDIDKLFSRIYQSLKSGGSFVFSVEHPVMTSSYGLLKPSGQMRESRPDEQYFSNRETYERRLRIPLFLMMKGLKKEVF